MHTGDGPRRAWVETAFRTGEELTAGALQMRRQRVLPTEPRAL